MIKALSILYKRYYLLDFFRVLVAKSFARANLKLFPKLLLEENRYLTLREKGFEIQKSKKYVTIYRKDWGNLKVLLRPYTSDYQVFKQSFLNDEFEQLIKLINGDKSINTIIDAGANIGLSSIKFHSYFPNATIIPVEPDEENYRTLVENLNINNIKAHPIKAGIWDKTAKLYFDRSFRDGKEWSISLTDIPNGGESIDSISFNDIVVTHQLRKIDLLKIDIEGNETRLFKKNSSVTDFLNITKYIAIEVHEEFDISEDITAILSEKGFSLSRSGEYLIGANKGLVTA